jgi:malate synthase
VWAAAARSLYDFIKDEALPGTGRLARSSSGRGLDRIVHDLAPVNGALLQKRDELQARIDAWHGERRDRPQELEAYKSFLREIGYLLPEGEDFSVSTSNVDAEIAATAGPQLVVPVMNARYALNAANARWGSLYDALYGTDAISEEGGAERGRGYNPVRGRKVVDYGRDLLDRMAPLSGASWRDATGFTVDRGRLSATLGNWTNSVLGHSSHFAGYVGQADAPTALLLKRHGLHVEVRIDRQHRIGSEDPAGIADVVIESALTTIMDFEDSIAPSMRRTRCSPTATGSA